MNKSFAKKFVSLTLVFVIMASFTGCSDFLNEIATEKVTDYMEDVLADFANDPIATVEENSLEEVEFTELTDEQREVCLENLSSVDTVLKKISVSEDRTSATVTVTFKKVMDFYDDTDLIGTEDEIREYFDDCATTDVPMTFKLERQEDGWRIEDMSEIDEVFFQSYADICFLDEQGFPINVTLGYVNSILVGSYWYDPIEGNPTSTTTMLTVYYLQNVFYFNHPMTMTFEAELRCDGEVVMSREVVVNNQVIAKCDFENENGSTFAPGTYTIALLYNGEVIAESDELVVR